MACVHNQNKIDALEKEINKLEQDVSDLEKNIEVYLKTIKDFRDLNVKFGCVSDNILEGNNRVSKESYYDNGQLDYIFSHIQKNVKELTDNWMKCKNEIESINAQIDVKNAAIQSLQGDCATCIAARYAALTLKEKQQHS